MITVSVLQSLVVKYSPEAKRGRYIAVSGIRVLLTSAIGPGLAGFVMDYYDPRWVWYTSGVLALVAAENTCFSIIFGSAV